MVVIVLNEVPVIINPKESQVREILLKAKFDEMKVTQFLSLYVLTQVFSYDKKLNIEFVFVNQFDEEFINDVVSFFRYEFGSHTNILFRKVKQEDFNLYQYWSQKPNITSFSKESREIERNRLNISKDFNKILHDNINRRTKEKQPAYIDAPSTPLPLPAPQPVTDAPKTFVHNDVLLNNDEKILPPVKKSRKLSKIDEPVKKIADIRAADKNFIQQVVIVGEIGSGERNGVTLREIQGGGAHRAAGHRL